MPIILTPLLFVCCAPFLVLCFTDESPTFITLACVLGSLFLTSAIVLLVNSCVFNPMCACCPFCVSDDDIERGFKHAAALQSKKLQKSCCCGKRILDRVEVAQQNVLMSQTERGDRYD